MGYESSARFYDLFDSKGNVTFYVDLAREIDEPALELGVGTGRVAIEIAKLGKEVYGIDDSPAMLAEAKKKLVLESKDVRQRCHFIEGDMRSFDLGRTFDLIYSPSAGLNHPTTEDTQRCIQSAYRHLAPGGTLAFDLMSPRLLRKNHYGLAGSRKLPDGKTVNRAISQEYDTSEDAARFVISYDVMDPKVAAVESVTESGTVAVMTADQITEMLEQVGFSIEKVFGGFRGEELSDESDWIVIVAQRK
jgi:ubiquinone/menaquinone biosynthesis C-methylase UbiE